MVSLCERDPVQDGVETSVAPAVEAMAHTTPLQAYFTGAEEPYEKLKRARRAEIGEAAWAALYSTRSYPFDPPETGKIAVKVINQYGDEVLCTRCRCTACQGVATRCAIMALAFAVWAGG